MKYYIASPYSHPFFLIRWWRWWKVCKFTVAMLKNNYIVFSPIIHCHWITVLFNLPKDFKFWMHLDTEYIKSCDAIIIYMLPGWKNSVGITWEIRIANSLNKRIYYLMEPSSCLPKTKENS